MSYVNELSSWFDYPAFIGRVLAIWMVWHLLPGDSPVLGFAISFFIAAACSLAEAKMNVDLQTKSELEDDNDWENRHV